MERLTLRGATVVGVRDGTLTPDADVVLEGGRIQSVGRRSREGQELAPGHIIDVAGRYLVPGFVETHVHALDDDYRDGALDLMLSVGITGFRQMTGSPALLRQRREGKLGLAPGAPALLAMPGLILTPINAGTVQVALDTVGDEKAEGADFIKVGFVDAEVYYAVQAEANRLGIPVAGHLPVGIDVRRAAREGIRAIEHLGPQLGVIAACSSEEEEILAALRARPARLRMPPFKLPGMERLIMPLVRRIVTNPQLTQKPEDVEILRRALDTFSEDKARQLAQLFVASGTWHCPTLIRTRTGYESDAPEFRSDANLRYTSGATQKRWARSSVRFDELPDATKSAFRDAFGAFLRLTRIFDEEGVRMLAGSDACGAIWEIPGHALHQEFDLLARAGLTPLRVLQMTTSDAADFLGRADHSGTVEAGRDADLVVLDGNPLESVANLHAVTGVVREGQYLGDAELAALQRRAEELSAT